MPLSPYKPISNFGLEYFPPSQPAVPLTNGIVANMFGIKYLSMLSGIVFFTHQVGSFFGGWLGGVNHDVTGNYDLIWLFSIILSVFGVLVHFFVDEKAVVHD